MLSGEVRGDPPPFYPECGLESSMLEPDTVPGWGVMARSGAKAALRAADTRRVVILHCSHDTLTHPRISARLTLPRTQQTRVSSHSNVPLSLPVPTAAICARRAAAGLYSPAKQAPRAPDGSRPEVTIPRAFSRCCRSQLHIAADAALLLRVTSLARVKKIFRPFAA